MNLINYQTNKTPLILWVITVTILSLMPVDVDSLQWFPHQDKVVHCIFYLIMAFLLGGLFGQKSGAVWVLILIPAFYGIMMEILQGWLGRGRHFDSFDIIANIIGALIGTLLFYSIGSKNKIDPTKP